MAQSGIELRLLDELPPLDNLSSLFFTSPGAVRLFYGHPDYADCTLPVGVIGRGTASALPKHVCCHYVGEGSTEEAAEAFALKPPKGCVGIVGGRSSRRTLQQKLAPHHYREIVIYETLERRVSVRADTYVFTSPSNYQSFRSTNDNPHTAGALVVAMGNSTAEKIYELDGYFPRMPDNYSARALWNTILSAQ